MISDLFADLLYGLAFDTVRRSPRIKPGRYAVEEKVERKSGDPFVILDQYQDSRHAILDANSWVQGKVFLGYDRPLVHVRDTFTGKVLWSNLWDVNISRRVIATNGTQ